MRGSADASDRRMIGREWAMGDSPDKVRKKFDIGNVHDAERILLKGFCRILPPPYTQ
jgi:hypothetical protein